MAGGGLGGGEGGGGYGGGEDFLLCLARCF
jgi:hypothetical protein